MYFLVFKIIIQVYLKQNVEFFDLVYFKLTLIELIS